MKKKFKTMEDVERKLASLNKKWGDFKVDYDKEFPVGRALVFHKNALRRLTIEDPERNKNLFVFQSLWSKPLGDILSPNNSCQWDTRLAFLCCWGLSAALLRKHYRASLFTDDQGYELLDRLGLEVYYEKINLSLQNCRADSINWNYGKIGAINLACERGGISEIFHVDLDVLIFEDTFGWNPKSEKFLVQGLEEISGEGLISKLYLEAISELQHISKIGPDLALKLANLPRAYNTGIYRSSDLETTLNWTSEFLNIACLPLNGKAWALEQLLLAKHIARKKVRYLYSKYFQWETHNPYAYVHFMAHSKKNKACCNALIDLVENEMPEFFERARKLC